MRLSPRLTQTVKTLLPFDENQSTGLVNFTADWGTVGEAEAGHAGEQTAKE